MPAKMIQWDFDLHGKITFYWQTHDKKILKRINQLVKDISQKSVEGIGKPEPLKEKSYQGCGAGGLMGNYRIVYAVEDNTVLIFSCRGHYND